MKQFLLILLFSCSIFAASAQTKSKADTLEVYFHQGKHYWDPNFKDNAVRMEAFANRITSFLQDTTIHRIKHIHIVAGASPEGYLKFNKNLSANRAKTMRKVLKSYVSLPDSMIVEDSRGVNWEGLKELVAASDMEYRDEVLHILHTAPEFLNNREVRKLRLMYLRNGEPWKYMYEHYYPLLRSFNMQIIFEWELLQKEPVKSIEPMPKPEPQPLTTVHPEPNLDVVFPVIIEDPLPPFYMAAKTNMLYDAALVPNVGLEFYLGKGFTISGNWMYAWWDNRDANWWHRIYGGDLEVRKYFGGLASLKPLQGWHAGLYAQIVTYDFEMGARGYLGDRWSWGAGASMGYSLPIKPRLNLDFTLGIGYLGGKYKEYLPFDDCDVWQSTKYRNWIGPTKAEISLVWLIGRGNVNIFKKGGDK